MVSPLHASSLFLCVSNAKEQPGGENDIQAISPSLCGHHRSCRLHFLQLPQWSWGWVWVARCGRPDGHSLARRAYRGERWVAPRGPIHNVGRLCIHIHLYQWATGKCKPKVIALDKNICLVNKYSNEGSLQVPQTDARLTGLRRDRR